MRDADYFIRGFFADRKEIVGAEIGVCEGAHAFDMLDNIKNISKLYLVDNFSGVLKVDQGRLNKRLDGYGSRTTRYWVTSEQAAFVIPDKSLDFVYIDANHDYKFISQDIDLWYPKLKDGGILCGHDYYCWEGFFGVKRAVDEFIKETGWHLSVGRIINSSGNGADWWIVLEDEHRQNEIAEIKKFNEVAIPETAEKFNRGIKSQISLFLLNLQTFVYKWYEKKKDIG